MNVSPLPLEAAGASGLHEHRVGVVVDLDRQVQAGRRQDKIRHVVVVAGEADAARAVEDAGARGVEPDLHARAIGTAGDQSGDRTRAAERSADRTEGRLQRVVERGRRRDVGHVQCDWRNAVTDVHDAEVDRCRADLRHRRRVDLAGDGDESGAQGQVGRAGGAVAGGDIAEADRAAGHAGDRGGVQPDLERRTVGALRSQIGDRPAVTLRVAAGADDADPQAFRIDVGRRIGDRYRLIGRHRIADTCGDRHRSRIERRIGEPIDGATHVHGLVRQIQLAVGRTVADVAGVGHEADRGTAAAHASGRRVDADRQAAVRRARRQQVEAAAGEHRRTVAGDAAVQRGLRVAGGLVEHGEVLVGGSVDADVAKINGDRPGLGTPLIAR